ncbi:MAG: hypothetical protein ACI8PG_005450, partial [Planctomycetota bacterium]
FMGCGLVLFIHEDVMETVDRSVFSSLFSLVK